MPFELYGFLDGEDVNRQRLWEGNMFHGANPINGLEVDRNNLGSSRGRTGGFSRHAGTCVTRPLLVMAAWLTANALAWTTPRHDSAVPRSDREPETLNVPWGSRFQANVTNTCLREFTHRRDDACRFHPT